MSIYRSIDITGRESLLALFGSLFRRMMTDFKTKIDLSTLVTLTTTCKVANSFVFVMRADELWFGGQLLTNDWKSIQDPPTSLFFSRKESEI